MIFALKWFSDLVPKLTSDARTTKAFERIQVYASALNSNLYTLCDEKEKCALKSRLLWPRLLLIYKRGIQHFSQEGVVTTTKKHQLQQNFGEFSRKYKIKKKSYSWPVFFYIVAR